MPPRPPQPGAAPAGGPRPQRPMPQQGRPVPPGANGDARARGENGAPQRAGRPQGAPGFTPFPEMEADSPAAPGMDATRAFPADEGAGEADYHPDASFHGDTDFDFYGEERRPRTDLVPDTRYEGGTPYVNLPAEGKAKAGLGGGQNVLIGWAVLGLVVLAILGIFFGMSKTVASALPGASRVYAALGMSVSQPDLVFQKVHYAWNKYEGQNMLQVEGNVRNTTGADIKVPNVLIALLDAKGGTISEWMSPAADKPLAPGASTSFATQIPSPPVTTKSFKVSFQKPKS